MTARKPPAIKPGSGTIVADLGRGQIVTLDLAAVLDALYREVALAQDETPPLSPDTWREMAQAALTKTQDNR